MRLTSTIELRGSDCRVRPCNHTFADSFEKRDDWISVSRGSSLTNVSISLGMKRVGFRRRALVILSGTPDPDSQPFLSKLFRAMLELEFGFSLTLWRMPRPA
jgi:hypothetical protein